MRRLTSLAASALAAALTVLPVAEAEADLGVTPRYGVAPRSSRPNRGRPPAGFTQRRGAPRGHGHGERRRHDLGYAPRNLAPRVYGVPGTHALGAGCSAVTDRGYDRYGRLVLLHRTLCFDRFGHAYILGGPARYRH